MDSFTEATKVADYKAVFLGGEKGKKVLYDIAADCGLDADGFSKDPYENAYMAGKRSVIIGILSKLNLDVRDLLTETIVTEDVL